MTKQQLFKEKVAKSSILVQKIIDLIDNPTQYELVTFDDGTQAKVRTINSVSDQARKDIIKVFKQLVKDGKIL